MSADQLKQTITTIVLKLLNSAWSMVVVFVGLIWLWLRLDDAQVQRIQELEPILNSKIGGFFIILIVISYIISIFGSLKDEIRLIFTLPIQMMAKELTTLIKETQDVQKSLLYLIEQGKIHQNQIDGIQTQNIDKSHFL